MNQENKNRLEALLGSIDEIIFEFDEKGTYLNIWTANEELLVRPKKELLGRKVKDFFDEEFTRRIVDSINRVIATGKSESFDYSIDLLGGKYWFLGRLNPIPSPDGIFKSVCFLARDITDRKHMEQKLRESDERFREIANNIHEAFWLFDWQEQRVIYISPAYEKIWGRSREDLYNRYEEWSESIHPDDLAFAEKSFSRIIETGGGERREYRIVRQDGTVRWISDRGFAIRDKKGEVIRITGIAEDITEQKRFEEELRKSEERYRTIFEQAKDPIYFTAPDGTLIDINPAGSKIFGYTREEFRRKNVLTHFVDPKERRKINEELERRGHIKDREVKFFHKDGTEIICLDTAIVVRDLDGEIRGYIGTLRDITEVRRAEKEKAQLEKQLLRAQKLEAIGTLAGGIAHDFNNLLMGIQGRTSLMMTDIDSSHAHAEHLKGIEEYIKSATDLTKQLLGFARGGKYEVKPTDLNDLIKNSSHMFARTKKEIRIHQKFQQDLWTVEADQNQIEQVLLNLYVNAWQAMPAGGELYIHTENTTLDEDYVKPYFVHPGKYVKISITDTGVGMDEATHQKIFDPFFTTKEMGRGTGLGLASAYGIIRNHDGIINVYSEKGEGATFNIYLPASEREVTKETELVGELVKGTETVLLVDDEQMVIDVGRSMLEEIGYKAIVAEGGQAAIDLYQENSEEINVVILDMIMPDISGGETYDRLKEINPDIKVLLCSGYSINGQATEILNRGCNGFIQKPFKLKDLSQKMRKILDNEVAHKSISKKG